MKQRNLDFDTLRREFASRLRHIIATDWGTLRAFCQQVDLPELRVSQWANPRHINWPNTVNLMEMCRSGNISPTWLLFGIEPIHLSELGEEELLHNIGRQIITQLEPEHDRSRSNRVAKKAKPRTARQASQADDGNIRTRQNKRYKP